MIFWTIFFTISTLVATQNSHTKITPMGEIFFVSSQKELNTSLRQENQLQGLAVSVNFYRKIPLKSRTEIDELVTRVLSRKRPVFLYGQPFDNQLAAKLLVIDGGVEDGSGCTPTAWTGIVSLEADGPGKMCGADSKPRNEKNFRKWISDNWVSARAIFNKNK